MEFLEGERGEGMKNLNLSKNTGGLAVVSKRIRIRSRCRIWSKRKSTWRRRRSRSRRQI